MNKIINMEFVASNLWREYATYTVDSRAIPAIIDGLKPVHRLFLLASLDMTKTAFDKVAAVSGALARFGYNHGEQSAADAGVAMAQPWKNNICLIQGRGSFGTRLVPAAAQARYIYSKLHENFDKYVKDTDLAPRVNNPELDYPAFFVPVIPLVLANGCFGIATGYATNILPRKPEDIVQACKEYIKTGVVTNKLIPSWPEFKGLVEHEGDRKYSVTGRFTRISKTVIEIFEVPVDYDREKYVLVLDELEDKSLIVGYEDKCGKLGFRFTVKLKRDADLSDDEIVKMFKLKKNHTESITAIDPNRKVRVYESAAQVIAEFCDFRRPILQKRIDKETANCVEEIRFMQIKAEFIRRVLNDEITFKGKTKAAIGIDILKIENATKPDIDKILASNLLSLTKEMIEDLTKKIKKSQANLKYWKETTVDAQFLDDLEKVS